MVQKRKSGAAKFSVKIVACDMSQKKAVLWKFQHSVSIYSLNNYFPEKNEKNEFAVEVQLWNNSCCCSRTV